MPRRRPFHASTASKGRGSTTWQRSTLAVWSFLQRRGPLAARGAAPGPGDAVRVGKFDHLAAAASLGGGSKALARASALQLSRGPTCRWTARSTPRHGAEDNAVAAEACWRAKPSPRGWATSTPSQRCRRRKVHERVRLLLVVRAVWHCDCVVMVWCRRRRTVLSGRAFAVAVFECLCRIM